MRYIPAADHGRVEVSPSDLYAARKSDRKRIRAQLAAARKVGLERRHTQRLERARQERTSIHESKHSPLSPLLTNDVLKKETAPPSLLEVELAKVAARGWPCCRDSAPDAAGLAICAQHLTEARRRAVAAKPIRGDARGSRRR